MIMCQPDIFSAFINPAYFGHFKAWGGGQICHQAFSELLGGVTGSKMCSNISSRKNIYLGPTLGVWLVIAF